MAKISQKPWQWVLTCEHASKRIPREYASLGLARSQVSDHIGWDIGARAVQRCLSRTLPAPCVASSVSRLLIDPNRRIDEDTLIPQSSDEHAIPGNLGLTLGERARRIRLYHDTYHARVDTMVRRACRAAPGRVRLLSIHSFTPTMNGCVRDFDIGVLFDAHVGLAKGFGGALAAQGLRVRYNKPYSGYDGLIYAPKRHGEAHGIAYLELEINNILIRDERGIRRISAQIRRALGQL